MTTRLARHARPGTGQAAGLGLDAGRYRTSSWLHDTGTHSRVDRCLLQARDALDAAMWALGGAMLDQAQELHERNSQAREQLVVAATALSRARVFMPALRTLDRPVVLDEYVNPVAEHARLRDLADSLLWRNHEHLPPRAKALPLAPEDEAQLRRLHKSLAGQRRFRALAGHPWFMACALAGALTPALGLGAGVAAIAFGSLELAGMVRTSGISAGHRRG